MKTIAFAAALATATAFTAPAMAAGEQAGQPATGNLTEAQTEATTQAGAGQQAGMSGERMEETEIRDIQQALKDAGHDVEVDGQWGDETAQALRDYQEQEGLTPSGELDSETLTALGLDLGTGVTEGGTQAAETPATEPGEEPMPKQKPDEAMQPQGGTSAN